MDLPAITYNDRNKPTHVLANIGESELLMSINQKVKSSLQCYYEAQRDLAQKIIERIRLIFEHHHDGQLLEDFKDFDFQIYTSRTNTLKEQTKSRLLNPESGCIPTSCSDVSKFADARVHLYQLQAREKKRYEDLQTAARENPEKLFFIVADEAHWGITSPGERGMRAHDQLINTWHPFKNVIVLLVTATAYNLLTEASRLPLDIFCAESLSTGDLQVVKAERTPDGETERLMKDGEDVTDRVGPKVALHHIKWTETYSSRLEKGMKMVIRTLVTSSDSECGKPVYLGPKPNAESELVPLVGLEECSDDLTLLFQGRNGKVRIFDAKNRQLKLLIDELPEGKHCFLGFVPPEAKITNNRVIDEFEMVLSFGEDIFALYPIGTDRLSLYYDQVLNTMKVHRKPPTTTLGDDILIELPVTDLLFIHRYTDDSSTDSFRYMSLNHYYNTIWHASVDAQKVRCDEGFERLCQKMLQEQDNRTRLHNQTDLFIAEYCIFLICLSEFKKLFTSYSDLSGTKKVVVKEILERAREIRKKLTAFREELQKSNRVNNDEFVNQEVIEDVLEHHKNIKSTSPESSNNKWKKVLQACLFGDSNLATALAKEAGGADELIEMLKIMQNEVINSYETGKIIADMMQITAVDGQLQGRLSIIKVSENSKATKLFSSLELAQETANKDCPIPFDIVRDYGKHMLSDIYKERDVRKYKLHLLVQSKCCQNSSGRGFCGCKEYTSTKPLIECTKCKHLHNPMAKFEDLEGLPAILILVDKGKMGDTFPTNFKSMDLRIKCPDRKKEGAARMDNKKYVLSSTVQELGRLCHYRKEDDIQNVPYALVPKSMVDFLKKNTTSQREDQGNALLYSSFMGTQSIDRFTQAAFTRTRDGDRLIMKPSDQSFECPSESNTNMILLDAEPQCGKTGTYCNVIAELRKLICKEVAYSDIDDNAEEESDKEGDQREDEEVKWQHPYHEQMSSEKLTINVGGSDKYTPIHGFWSPGKAPTKRPAFETPWVQAPQKPLKKTNGSVGTCHVPYKAECFTHKCSDCFEKGIIPASVVYDLVIDGLVVKIHVTNGKQSPLLMDRIAKVPHMPVITGPSSMPCPTDLRTWIFIPTAGRAKSACLNLKHTMRGPISNDDNTEIFKTYIQVLVVQEKDFQEYCSIWGSKVTAILQLPSSMMDDDNQSVSAVEGRIGYSRRFIHLFAKVLGLEHIFMIDDRVWFFHEAQFEKGRVKQNDNRVEFKCVPFYKVLLHLESQFHKDTPRPRPSSDFHFYQSDRECDLPELSELEKYTGPSGNYAALGVRKARLGSERVMKPFKKVHVYSLYLLNVKSTAEKKITFQPWEAFDDIDFNERSDRNDLWICKYNRFLLYTKRVHSAPTIFFWNEEVELTQEKGHLAENEVQRLAKWIGFFVKPRWKYPIGGFSQNSTLGELYQNVTVKKHKRNSFFICVHQTTVKPDDIKDAIKRLNAVAKAKEGLGLYIIAVPLKLCQQHSLKKLPDIRKVFDEIFKEGYILQVATSHNVQEFQIQIVLISVVGEEIEQCTVMPPPDQTRSINGNLEPQKQPMKTSTAASPKKGNLDSPKKRKPHTPNDKDTPKSKQNKRDSSKKPGPASAKRRRLASLHWTPEEVKVFLDENGFEEFSDEFVKQDIDGATLRNLDKDGFVALGLKDPIKRAKLLGKIEKLKLL